MTKTTPARFRFEKGTKKGTCPHCNKPGQWRYYTDTKTGERLPEQYGKCERLNNCGVHLSPYDDGYSENVFASERGGEIKPIIYNQQPAPKQKDPVYIPENVLNKSLEQSGTDTLLSNLSAGNGIKRAFSKELISEIIDRYKVGVSNAWISGATCFPFIDVNGNIQGIQVKKFDTTNHTEKFKHSSGEIRNRQSNVHTILKFECDKLKLKYPDWLQDYLNYDGVKFNCFFGEHLLPEYPNKKVAIVEAPKTAIVASVYFPQFVWLASDGLDKLTVERCKVLKGRSVVFFPDLSQPTAKRNSFQLWSAKAEQLKNVANIQVFDFLEREATPEEREQKLDLCDYLLKEDYLKFVTPPQDTTPQQEIRDTAEALEPGLNTRATDFSYTKNTCEPFDIEGIEADLKKIELPQIPVRINAETLIQNCSLFVSSHLATLRQNRTNKTFQPHYDRLKTFIEVVNPKENIYA